MRVYASTCPQKRNLRPLHAAKQAVSTLGQSFDVARGNAFESHIRRTTPVGIFDNSTPEGAYDLTGNAYTTQVDARAASRNFISPDSRYDAFGFRLVRPGG